MTRIRRFIYTLCLVFCSFFFVQCQEYSTVDLAGTYVNFNYEYKPFIPDIPYVADTLIIFTDSTFKSDYFGIGKYEILNSFKGSSIRLIYYYGFGQASSTARLGEDENGNVKINLFEQENHYYKKID